MSERKRDYPSGALKRKNKQKKENVLKKLPKISSFFQQSDIVTDLDCNGNGKYLSTPRKKFLLKFCSR